MFFKKNKKEIYKPKIWIYLDMEGINNITKWDEVNPACANYKKGQKLMHEELNSVIKGTQKAGVSEIFINDLHWSYDNIIWNKLIKGTTSKAGENLNIEEFLNTYFDAIFIVGMHAKNLTKNSILPHSWYLPSYIKSLQYNEKPIGEIGLIKLLADEKGIPAVFISGDKAGCEEAKNLYPNIFTATTKEKTKEKIILLSQKKANNLVYRQAIKAVKFLQKQKNKTKPIYNSKPLDATFATIKLTKIIEERCKEKNINHKKILSDTIRFKRDHFSNTLKDFFSVLD